MGLSRGVDEGRTRTARRLLAAQDIEAGFHGFLFRTAGRKRPFVQQNDRGMTHIYHNTFAVDATWNNDDRLLELLSRHFGKMPLPIQRRKPETSLCTESG